MPKSTTKHVLIVRHGQGKGTATYPVSVHVSKQSADSFKNHLAATIATGDDDAVKALAPTLKRSEDGKLPSDLKWAVVTLPYDPALPGVEEGANDFEL
jgi:hypothetical protein